MSFLWYLQLTLSLPLQWPSSFHFKDTGPNNVLKSLHNCKVIWADCWETNIFVVWILFLMSHGVYRRARCEEEKSTYTAVVHPFSSLSFVCFVILHEGLHQVLGSLGSRRLLGQRVRLRDRAFCGGRWRRLDLLYLSCKDMKRNDPF